MTYIDRLKAQAQARFNETYGGGAKDIQRRDEYFPFLWGVEQAAQEFCPGYLYTGAPVRDSLECGQDCRRCWYMRVRDAGEMDNELH